MQGSGVDAGLNEFGRLQAETFFHAYQHISFDKIYTSKLKRSWESVEKFIAKRHSMGKTGRAERNFLGK